MHQMKLTNKQIQEYLVEVRKYLKGIKTVADKYQLDIKLPCNKQEKARLIILQTAWEKMIALIDECDKEIAWHGIVTKTNNTYTISDILIFPQTVTGCTVTSDDTEYSLWLANQPDNVFNNLRFHGHSHVNMGVTPSGVDTTYQDDILKNLQDFYIFAIFNKKGDHWCAIYDVKDNIAYSNTDIELITPNTGDTAWAKEAIKNFVKFPDPTPYKATRNSKGQFTKKPKESVTQSIMDDMTQSIIDEDDSDYPLFKDYNYGYPYYGGYHG